MEIPIPVVVISWELLVNLSSDLALFPLQTVFLNIPAGEFWDLRFTCVKLAKVEKYCYRVFSSRKGYLLAPRGFLSLCEQEPYITVRSIWNMVPHQRERTNKNSGHTVTIQAPRSLDMCSDIAHSDQRGRTDTIWGAFIFWSKHLILQLPLLHLAACFLF